MSIAEGNVTLSGSLKSIQAFLVINQVITDWDYTVKINDSRTCNNALSECNKSTEKTYPFFGTGYWTFEKTLKSLFRWIDNERDNDVTWTHVEESAWQQLNLDPLHLTFTYIDYDNSEFFVKEQTTVYWHKKQIDDPVVNATVVESYDMDAEHYDKLTAEHYYDYSTYTIEKMKKEDVNWIDHIENTRLSGQLDLNVFKSHTNAILSDLSVYLDKIRQDYGNALWSEVAEWFTDEEVQDGFEHAVGKYSKQNTH